MNYLCYYYREQGPSSGPPLGAEEGNWLEIQAENEAQVSTDSLVQPAQLLGSLERFGSSIKAHQTLTALFRLCFIIYSQNRPAGRSCYVC